MRLGKRKQEPLNDEEFVLDYEQFEENFGKVNPQFVEYELPRFEKLRRKILYYDINLWDESGVKFMNFEVAAETYLRKAKVVKHDIVGSVINYKGKKTYLYSFLEGTILGFIPLENGKCILVKRRRISLFDILFPIALVRILVYLIAGV